jgi:hypothetical protein
MRPGDTVRPETIILKNIGSLASSSLDLSFEYNDVHDLSNSDLSGLSGIAASATKEFEIAVRLKPNADKGFQADGINLIKTFILNQ